MALRQPLTAKQLAKRIGLTFDECREVVRRLSSHGFLKCLNPEARRSRVYWLTTLGVRFQKKLARENQHALAEHFVPEIDWDLYGSQCYSHRSTIIETLTEPMQPAMIKRRARQHDHSLRLSGNNARDIVRDFRKRGIVQSVEIRKKAHLRYELTEQGKIFQQLLWQAEALV